ncbi:MAG: arsenic efflux protein [Bacteroidales bacterium]|nr:arsenic efflux protein [Bacteroidales bacterium]
MILEILIDTLRNALLITGLVVMMMLMIEYLNVASAGRWASSLRRSKGGQVLLGGLLGVLPGCMGGFAAVSLYSHGMLSFGALVAMLIASSGDEAFVMLAMFPQSALILMVVLLVIGIAIGLLVDMIPSKRRLATSCDVSFEVHPEDHHHHHDGYSIRNIKDFDLRRVILLAGMVAFIVALMFGLLDHEHADAAAGHAGEMHEGHHHEHHGFNILDEYWLNLVFSVLSLFVIWFTASAPAHFIREHLWEHIIKKHLLSIFCWSFGALLLIGIGLEYFDIASWTKDNAAFMILLAVLVGIIPESGPHLIFVTLFASGAIPFSVLLASSISQDGHSGLPLLAETKQGFVQAKIVNCIAAAAAGYLLYFFGL